MCKVITAVIKDIYSKGFCCVISTTLISLVCLHNLRLEKEMATHSSTLAWEILWTEEPGRLQSMGSHQSRHDLTVSPKSMCIINSSILQMRTQKSGSVTSLHHTFS